MADSTDKKEPWLNWLALSTVILALCATLATFKGGGYSTKSIMNQSLASDQWAYFESKSVKGYLYDVAKDRLELDTKTLKQADTSVTAAYKKKLAEYDSKIAKYSAEKDSIKAKAANFETIRDDCKKHSGAFGMAVIFLQLAIVLSSIAALMKRPLIWNLGLVLGVVGVIYFVNGFFLLF